MTKVRRVPGFTKVARDVVLEIPERYDGYRAQLVHKLTDVIGCQRSGLSNAARRKEVRRVLEAFGQQVAAETNRVEAQ